MTDKTRVLIVDDDPNIQELVCWVLTEEGYEVLVAPHGAAALELLGRTSIDLILLDWFTPVMDGPAFARAYRLLPGPHAPIVLFTALRENAERLAGVGAVSVLAKPFELSDLLAVVAATASHGDRQAAIPGKPIGPGAKQGD